MNLTLNVEDEIPELFITGVKSSSVFHELVYQVNKINQVNLIKERRAFTIENKKQKAGFDWFSLIDSNNSDDFLFLMRNVAHYKNEVQSPQSLFDIEFIEKRMIFLPSLKSFDYIFVHPTKDMTQVDLGLLVKERLIQAHKCLNIKKLKRAEQQALEKLYYEKQD